VRNSAGLAFNPFKEAEGEKQGIGTVFLQARPGLSKDRGNPLGQFLFGEIRIKAFLCKFSAEKVA